MSSSKGEATKENSSFLVFASGVLIGGAIGTVLGMILAPRSGTEMRYQLSEGVHDAQSKTKQVLGETKSSISQSVDKATRNLESTVKRVTESFNAGRKAALESMHTDAETEKTEAAKTEKFADVKISDKINESLNKSDLNKSDKNEDSTDIKDSDNANNIKNHESSK